MKREKESGYSEERRRQEEERIRTAISLFSIVLSMLIAVAVYYVQPIQLVNVVNQTVITGNAASALELPADVVFEDSAAYETPEPSPGVKGDSLEEGEKMQEILVAKSININTATAEELDKLPGIGPVLADRIIQYREANQGFLEIDEIMEVEGIGEKTFLKLEDFIFAE